MSFEPAYYTIGAYDPWTGEGKPQWLFDKKTKQAYRRPTSALQDDEVMARMLLELRPGRDPLCSIDNGLGLVLGILPWGDYAILIPSMATPNLSINFLPTKHRAGEFLSLSPIFIKEKKELVFVLKGGKERRSSHRGGSKNRRRDGPADLNAVKFAKFEHARVFYYKCFKRFYPIDLGIPTMFSDIEPKIVVLHFNFFQPRVHAEDMEEMLLDAAWGLIDFPSKTVDDIVYVSVTKGLNNPGRSQRAVQREGKRLDISDIPEVSKRLRHFFLSLDPAADVIILAHDLHNLSRGLCFLGLDDIYPQARATVDKFRRWQSVLNDGNDWEGVGALVGYPERSPVPSKLEPKLEPNPDPYGRHSLYDSRSPSAASSSSHYLSASPFPEGSREASVRPPSTVPDYGSASERSDSVYSERYGQRADREYSRDAFVKQETYGYDRESSARSETPLFRPPSRSPSERPSGPPDYALPSSAPFPSKFEGGEDQKIVPLDDQDFPEFKPFAIKEEGEKKPKFQRGFADAPRRTFALDTQALHATSGRMWTERDPLYKIAVDMGLHESDPGICAANELLDIWNVASRMLSGPPIFFVKGYIEEEVRFKKTEEEYYKLEKEGRSPVDAPAQPGGIFGAPPPLPNARGGKKDFFEEALADDDEW
ncbi:hypothetical protein CALCODRAFT_552636 [Calocera cornea HHB12733]|uniref:Uncharacterized protein n=1 Tax=Calocera cornea HHB12733 TaxID=1353952 RepID=A0A165JUG6_9BASI|nr:hypothetical protein CALCODRAFT_552636 [Calocera cornea HHB12733]